MHNPLKYFKFRKISWKLTAVYAALFTLMFTLLEIGTLLGVRFFLVRQAFIQVRSSSSVILISIVRNKDYRLKDLADSSLLSEADANPELDVRIAKKNGKTINYSGKFKIENLSVSARPGRTRVLRFEGKHLVVRNTPIVFKGKTVAYFQVVYNMEKEFDFIRILFFFMAFSDIFGVFSSILAGYFVSRRTLQPIDSIAREAKTISIHNLRGRIAVGPANDELSRLAVTINQMIERLQQSYEKQNRFVSDASHELRTPISIIKGYISLIDEWGKDDRSVLDESIAAISNEADGMTLLIERLLFLARGDSGHLTPQREPFDLVDVVREVLTESRMIAPRLNFSEKTDKKVSVFADYKLIKQALRAVVDNSIKFTPEGGSIEIGAHTGEKFVELFVRDTGAGIAAADLPHIFDRFYRADKARTKEKGGTGLGLSIVRYIAESHGGSVRIKSAVNEGTTVTMRLPLPPNEDEITLQNAHS